MKKNYTISIPVRSFWTIWLPAAVLLMGVGVIAGVFVVDRLVMPNLPGISNKGVLSAPDLSNLSYREARRKLYEVGLRSTVEEREYSELVPEDGILSQRPAAGTKVKKGRHIVLVLSKGPEVDTIPDVRGLTERQARKKLREKGFGSVEPHKAYDEEVPKDRVAETEPGAGTVISRELAVNLTVSRGPKPTHSEVPNIIGELLSEAKLKIEESDLATGRIQYRQTSTSRPGTVISQSPAPGSSVPLESSVDIIVAGSR
ncbi:MAG: PASTA domain-containing protein [Chitinivibrionales bacterium]|nr:PASTA domain-containing protein [Chitinivibrionales bacterium]MBD3357395.1 PASTA domain-containing protein [Chitinivibrionales bacterium]